MRAGQLRYRVTLQQPDTTAISGFADVLTVSADVRFQPGAETVEAGGVASVARHQMRLRYRDDVRADWRVLLGARTFQILGYGDPDGRRSVLELSCAEVQ